jgi:hypothetical protein
VSATAYSHDGVGTLNVLIASAWNRVLIFRRNICDRICKVERSWAFAKMQTASIRGPAVLGCPHQTLSKKKSSAIRLKKVLDRLFE